MYSGSDSADSQKYSQWPINAASYQNSSSDQVDWAALAQQWIIMKEAGPPPIPGNQRTIIHKEVESRIKKDSEEGGEAPMDVENEKEEQPTWNAPGNSAPVDGVGGPLPPPPPGTETWNAWNSTGNANWNWSNTWNSPSVVPPPVKPPLLPTPEAFSAPPDSASDNAVPFRAPGSNNFSPGFWTGMGAGKVTQTEIKPHNKRYSKVNVPTKVTIITPTAASNTPAVVTPVAESAPVPVAVPVTASTIDANKRKQLPAWIREGLEKMEKDKQKQLEKEREKHAREEFKEKVKLEEKEKMEILKREVMQRSRFDSDNERSEDEDEPVKRKTPPPSVPLTAEELMAKVRKTMTEILLKVTNQQIAEICQDERLRYLKKKRASDHLASAPSGAVLSAKLGLGAYDDDEDDSNSSPNSDGDNQREDDDSDLELKESILRRQTEFSKTERQIESRLAEAQCKKVRDKSLSSASESDGDSPTDTRADNASWRNVSDTEKRRTTGGSTSSSTSSNYVTPKSRSRRRSSSSDSSDRHGKSHSGSSDRSRRQERKRRSRSRSRSSRRSNKRRRSPSDSPYTRRSHRSRSRSSRRSTKASRRSSRSRSGARDRKYSPHRSRRSESRSRSYRDSFSNSRRNRSSSRRDRSRSRRRRSSRSSSRGKRSRRR